MITIFIGELNVIYYVVAACMNNVNILHKPISAQNRVIFNNYKKYNSKNHSKCNKLQHYTQFLAIKTLHKHSNFVLILGDTAARFAC